MGRAFLFNSVVNVHLGEADDRHMRTGKHTVRDVSCARCNAYLGWKYVCTTTYPRILTQKDRAFVSAEKYKEGKFILEHRLLDLVD